MKSSEVRFKRLVAFNAKVPVELIFIGVPAIVKPLVPSCVNVASSSAPKLITDESVVNFRFPVKSTDVELMDNSGESSINILI